MDKEKIFYFLYFILNFQSHWIVIIYCLKSIIKLSFKYHFFQLLSSILSLLILHVTRNKPGYIYKNENLEKKVVKNETNLNKETSPIFNFNLNPNNDCKICEINNLPLRSQHCIKCGKCIRGFDHHIWILAGCVGENNRFKFILFLFFENISICLSLYGILTIMNNQRNEGMTYFLTLLFSFICLIGIFFFWIFIYHIYLLITNQTTYEIFNEEKCPYLSKFNVERTKILAQRGIILNNPKLRPFDTGFINNIILYFKKMINSETEINWENIYFENLKSIKVNLNFVDKLSQSKKDTN